MNSQICSQTFSVFLLFGAQIRWFQPLKWIKETPNMCLCLSCAASVPWAARPSSKENPISVQPRRRATLRWLPCPTSSGLKAYYVEQQVEICGKNRVASHFDGLLFSLLQAWWPMSSDFSTNFLSYFGAAATGFLLLRSSPESSESQRVPTGLPEGCRILWHLNPIWNCSSVATYELKLNVLSHN